MTIQYGKYLNNSIWEIFISYNQSRKQQNNDSDTVYFSKVIKIL